MQIFYFATGPLTAKARLDAREKIYNNVVITGKEDFISVARADYYSN